jgi:hypothetical protein
LKHPKLDRIFQTLVSPSKPIAITTYMDPIPASFKRIKEEKVHQGVIVEGEFSYEYHVYSRDIENEMLVKM